MVIGNDKNKIRPTVATTLPGATDWTEKTVADCDDTTMLAQADHGFLFHAPESIVRQFPQFPAVNDYGDLLSQITSRM